MSGALRHLRVRLGAVLRSPGALAVILFSGLMTLLFSPSLPLDDGPGHTVVDTIARPLITIQWLWLVPALLTRAVTGRSTAPLWSQYEPAMPSLPVGLRGRILAEVTLVGLLLLLLRSPGFVLQPLADFIPGLTEGSFTTHWLVGALCLLPVTAAWASPAPTGGLLFLRPLVAAIAVYVAGVRGLLDSVPVTLAFAAALIALVLATAGREDRLAVSCRAFVRDTKHARPARPGPQALRRDLWRLPLERSRAWLVSAGIGLAVAMALDLAGLLPPTVWHLTASLGFGLLLGGVVLRPLGSPLPMAGFTRSSGYDLGAFTAAWGQLPVPRIALVRAAYGHGLVSGAALWALMIGLLLIRSFVHHGQVGLLDADGDTVAHMLLPALGAVPLLAAMLAAAAVGDRVRAWLAAGALAALLPAMIFVALAGTHLWGRTPQVELACGSAVVVVLVVIGALPALTLLREPAQSYSR